MEVNMNNVGSSSARRRSGKSFRKQVRKAFVRSLEQMRELFRQNDAARAKRYKEGDKGVYEEL